VGRLVSPDKASYKWWVTGTVTLSAFLTVMNSATVNVTLPPMMTAFGLNLDQAQWIISAYMIASAVLIPTVGWLGNCLGNRHLFLLSLLVRGWPWDSTAWGCPLARLLDRCLAVMLPST
jgi:DHA2 family multidrug resistance protein